MPWNGVVAAGHDLTAEAAEVILRAGGNAFDAILAAHFAACVSEPVLASLGGGGFMTAKACDREPVVYDFFVQTPRQKRPVDELDFRPILADFGKAQQEFHIGQGTIATPGAVKGIFQIHQDLGSIPISEIIAPAVQFARQGAVMNGTQAYILRIVRPIYTGSAATREIYCGGAARDQILEEGELMRQPQLAETLERLANEGAELFYRGEIGREIARHCRDEGGLLTAADLASYKVVKRKPLEVQYRGAQVLTNPPPSSAGFLIAFALQLLESLDLRDEEFGSYPYLRLLAEVMTLTNQARIEAWAQADKHRCFLNPEFLRRYREEVIGRAQAIRGTTQISVIDSQGNVASMTVSNGEGCGTIVPDTGIMLNNMLGEQDLNLDGFHRWTEDQRMTSMMAPSIIRMPSGALVATGSGGSNRIRTALLQVVMNLIHFQMDVLQAVQCPRIHLEEDKLSVEGGFAPDQIELLTRHYANHEVWADRNLFFGGAHTVIADQGTFVGAGDPRRGGVCRLVR